MATETETLSLPTTTAPTEVTNSPCSRHNMPSSSSGNPKYSAHHHNKHGESGRLSEMRSVDWDTNVTRPALLFPTSKVGSEEPSLEQRQEQHQREVEQRLFSQQQHQQHQSQQQQRSENDMNFTFTNTVEEASKRSLGHFPSADISFPMPSLDFDFRIAVELNAEPCRIENGARKEITTVSTGNWSGSFGNGKVVAGGYDLGQARGYRPIRIVEGAFVLQTSDDPPAALEMRTRGSLSGPCEILDLLLSHCKPLEQEVDPRQYGFRMFSTIKTSDNRYAEIVNCGLWVASGVWKGAELIIDAYRVT